MPSASIELTPLATGLNPDQVRQSRRRSGANVLPVAPRRGLARIALGVLREPMFLLLILAAAVYLMVGSLGEGLLLAGFALISIGLVALQERRSERAVEALKALGDPVVCVRRDAQLQRIDAAELVVGDLILIDEGERIPADGWIRETEALQVDESQLTGESVMVTKRALASGQISGTEPEQEQHQVYSGSLVSTGHALVQVSAVGIATRTGQIGRSLGEIRVEATRLQRGVGRIVRLFATLALIASVGLWLAFGLLRGDWLQGTLSAIALAMAMLPEEFPMAMAIFFAMGAWRLSQIQVLARRSSVVETLGAASVLCVDKTGTLTENQMQLAELRAAQVRWLAGASERPDQAAVELLQLAQRASRSDARDPMDRALLKLPGITPSDCSAWQLRREYPLTSALPVYAQAWQDPNQRWLISAKGAPEAIAELCMLSASEHARMIAEVNAMADSGLRVLALAEGAPPHGALPEQVGELHWQLRGLLGFSDPLRKGVPAALRTATAAGITVKMITGDHPQTALAIARQAGIDASAGVLAGDQLAQMDQATLRERVAAVNIYARVRPEQKLRLVEALKERGEVVAMTGDGVNDAPALKSAHIGIAMGERGTDVAREAAAIVLLKEDFSHLVDAVHMGRRIFDNLRKVMVYIAAIHLPIAGLALLPLLFGLPPMLLPAHVVLTEMLIDPMCSIAFENQPAEAGLMAQRPRRMDEPLIGSRELILALFQGLVLLLACLGLYAAALQHGHDQDQSRALAFVAMTAGNLAMIRSNSQRVALWWGMFSREQRAYWLIALLVSALLTAALVVPALRVLFGFGVPSGSMLILAVGIGLIGGSAMEWVKLWRRLRGRAERTA